MTETTPATPAGFLRRWLHSLSSIGRRRHTADMSGGAAHKMPPIADVLARAGREPRAPE